MFRGFRFTTVCAALLAALALVPGAVSAQTTLGKLAGTVLDQSGGVLPGATVTLTNVQTNAVETTVATETGAFLFPQVPAGTYKVEIALEGFKTGTFTDVVINVGQEYSLTAKLELGALTETVTVEAGQSLVKTTTPEVSSTIQQRQVLDIPLANRDVTNLIRLSAGVQAFTNRANTVINGGRPTWTQVTLDGINIQDNFIRTNSLDFLPNRPTSDNVAEFSMTTSVAGADTAGGATTVRMVTPSGSNKFTGSVFEFNRDAKFSANSFFNNASVPPVPKSELKRNQFGGRVGGPIVRDKLFFFANYEGFRQTTGFARNLTIPKSDDLLNGVFRYRASDGSEQSVNVLALSGLAVDPVLRAEQLSKLYPASNVNNSEVGDSRNTAGYRLNQTDLNNRDQYTFRGDYELSPQHRFEAGYSYFKETDDRTDLDFVSLPRPLVYTSSDPKRFWGAWRWTASSNFQNELRAGGNLAPVQFITDIDYAAAGVLYGTALGITNPVGGNASETGGVGFMDQGRYTNTYQLNDNASWMRGNHQIQMGGSWQRNRVNPYNFRGQYPQVTFGFSTAAPPSVQLSPNQFPGGISAADLANANALASWISGTMTTVAQTFQVKDTTSGYVPGIPANEFYTLDNIAAYVQDNWRWKPNFTVRAGLKWEYYSPLREDDNLGFLPVLNGRPFNDVMLSPTTTVSFVDGDFYNKDLNNFGPTAGFAWDLTKDGKTALRGGYSLTFVHEEAVTVGRGASRGNAGLSTTRTLSQLYSTVNAGVPVVTAPPFLTERTLADQVALGTTQVLWGIDPNLHSPYVHQFSIGLQREIGWATAVEARYVGTFGRDIWRGIDFNQLAYSPEFLADFNRARQNGYLSVAAGGQFDPQYSGPGSQPLTILPSFGLLTNATARSNIQTNQVGALVDQYISQVGAPGASSRAAFLPNSGIYASNGVTNGAFSDYNSIQLEARRRFKGGFFGQLNYTWSDTKTDSSGTAQNRFEAFMDNNRPELNTGRSIFHVTHVISSNAIFELPFGSGRRWMNSGGPMDWVLGGWQVGTIASWQSGSPISITSQRGTFNRAGRSGCADAIGCNTAVTPLSANEIKDLLGVHKVGDKIYWIDPKVIGPDGRAVGADNLGNTASFDGQIFFNPAAGEVGNLPVMNFDGPGQFRIDLALSKRFRFASRYGFEFKGEAFNLTNTPSFFIGDMNVNSTTFGRITGVNIGSRVIQLSGRFDF
jgi:hypothetical protein